MAKKIIRLTRETDPFGSALLDHSKGKKNLFIKVHSDATEEDHIQVRYLFRPFDSWPELEKVAISKCKGKILEVGAGAGSHSLYLQEKGQNVTSLDFSPGAVEVMRSRGLKDVVYENFEDFQGRGYDTILLLMNGIGLVGSIVGLRSFLNKCFTQLLNQHGQLLFDSSDLVYLLSDPESNIHSYKGKRYYGEVSYRMEYQGILGPRFSWLFIDFKTLESTAKEIGLKAEKVFEDDHFAYLARITRGA